MSIELQPIEIECGETNPAGIISLELVPKDWIPIFPDLNQQTNSLLTFIILEPLKNWLNIPFRPDSIKQDSQLTPDVQNGLYNNIIEFEIPSEKDTISATLEQYKRHLFIAKIKDKGSNTKIVGSKKSPCVFKYSYTSGKKLGDFKGYKVQIQQLSKTKPALYPF